MLYVFAKVSDHTLQIREPTALANNLRFIPALRNFLKGKMFATDDELKTAVRNFFNSKPVEFYTKDIYDLSHRWRVFENNGDSIVNLYVLNAPLFCCTV